MRRELVIAGVLLGTAAALPTLRAQPPADPAAVRRLAGCYGLTLGPWSGPLPSNLAAMQTPPAHFRLDTVPLSGRFAASGYAVQPREVWRRPRGVRPAAWRPLGEDSLTIFWTTGYVGVRLGLRARGDTLVGHAHTFRDAYGADEPPDRKASVVAARIPCAGALRAPTLRPDTGPPRRGLYVREMPDDEFADIAGRVPGFAGLLFSGDTLVLMLVDTSRRADAEGAVQHVVGGRYRHVAVRRAQYDFRQLRDWKHLAGRANVPGWTMLDADEARNRIVVGVRDSSYLPAARRALEAQGIPPGAIVVEVVSPVIPLRGAERTARDIPVFRYDLVQAQTLSLGGAFVNAWADFDADGDLDLFVGFNGTPNRLYRNDEGVLTDVAPTAGVADARSTRAAAWGDFDADGDPDLLVGFAPGGGFVLRLYRNDGGVFRDLTAPLGLAVDSAAVRQPVWVDVDGDDDLDLFVAFRDRPNALFRNDGSVFRDVAPELGLADRRRSVGAVWFDYDEDGDLDLYVGNMDGDANGLFRNDRGRFRDVAAEAGVAWGGRLPDEPTNGTVRPCAADVNGDGHLDLFTANYGKNGLFLSRGRGRFEDVSSRWGIDIDARYDSCAFADVDHDGRLDLYVNGTVTGGVSYRDYLFRNVGGRLEDVTPKLVRDLQADHGVQWADFDADGDVDLALTGARPDGMHLILRNALPPEDASRSLHVLVLDRDGRPTRAGAEVRLFAAGTRRLLGTRLVDSGSGYNAQSAMPVHFGLTADAPVDVQAIWPSRGVRVSHWVRGVDPRKWRGRVLVVRPSRRR